MHMNSAHPAPETTTGPSFEIKQVSVHMNKGSKSDTAKYRPTSTSVQSAGVRTAGGLTAALLS